MKQALSDFWQHVAYLAKLVRESLPTVKAKTLDTISLGIALLSGLLAYADTQQMLEFVSPTLAAKWPMFMASALAISRVARVFGDYLDNGKLDGSFGKDLPPLPKQTEAEMLADAEANRIRLQKDREARL